MNFEVHIRRQCTYCGYVVYDVAVMADHIRTHLYHIDWDRKEDYVFKELCLQQLSPLLRHRFLMQYPHLFQISEVSESKWVVDHLSS